MNAKRHFISLGVLAAIGVGATSCGDVARTGRAPVYLIIDQMLGIGVTSTGQIDESKGTSFLISDVVTNGTVFNDVGSVQLRTAMKDVTGTFAPSTNNDVTITRYHVGYRRADGRNTQGVDVPYAFDGAATGTVPAGGTLKLGFELVRNDAKLEPPLSQLVNNPQILNLIADVTFYGRDVVGNEISVTGSIQINAGNFADPKDTGAQ